MSDSQDLSQKRFPWLRSGFDLEGYVGALAAWFLGLLLGFLWGPLFWIGFIAAIVILFATRTAERTAPEGADLIVAPGDGIVVSVSQATPPSELRLAGENWSLIRVSVGPTKSNGLHAPVSGQIAHMIAEIGDPAAFAATRWDRPGLAVSHMSFESGGHQVGLRYATGGLGPRLEWVCEPGDAVRLGRNIGTLRLGGWCDIYLPGAIEVSVSPGQTLIGSETILGRFDGVHGEHATADMVAVTPAETETPSEAVVATGLEAIVSVEASDTTSDVSQGDAGLFEDIAPETLKTPVADGDTATETDTDALTLAKIAGAVSSADVVVNTEEEDVQDMLERLKREARRSEDDT
ncbi:MAG: phosphatidylserine decarboxylase [Pseudomonadota bacterium]